MPSKVLQVRKYLRDDGIAGVDNRRYCAGTSIGGGDEDDGVGRRDSGDVGSGLCGEVDVGSSISPSPPKKLFKAGLMRVDWCDEKRADKINESIMRFLTGCALPFTIVESHSCKHSRPLYDT